MKRNSTEQLELDSAQQNVGLQIIERKICSKCRIEKLTDQFYSGREGLFQSQCKKCKREGKRKTKSAFLTDNIKDGFAICQSCLKTKEINECNFPKSKIRASSKKIICKECRRIKARDNRNKNNDAAKYRHKKWRDKNRGHVRSYSKARKLSVKKATPTWFESELVKQIYIKACEFGFEVDHIVPINSDIVCGLHCHDNLQLLDKSINCSKKNRYWPDMP